MAHLFVDSAISVEILKQEEKILKNKRTHLLEEKELLEPRSNQPLNLEELVEKLPQATYLIREWIENAEGENITLLLDALDVKIKASKTEVQISGAMPIVTEKDENLVTIARTLALRHAYNHLYQEP